jgi:hypothetical protein
MRTTKLGEHKVCKTPANQCKLTLLPFDLNFRVDVARRASCAPLSWTSTNSARRPQTNAH